MLNILQIATLYDLTHGGAPYSTRSINNSINKFTQHKSKLLIVSRDHRELTAIRFLQIEFFIYFNRTLNKFIPISYGVVPNRQGMKYLENQINSVDLVIFHQFFSISNLIAARICRKLGKKYLVVPHGSLNDYHLNYHKFRKKLFLKTLGRNFISGARAIVCASEMESAQISKRFRVITEVLGLGQSEEIFEVQKSPENLREIARNEFPSFLFLGRITPKKLVSIIILAFARFQKQFPQAKLIIAGTGELAAESELKQLVREQSIEASVSFLGWIGGAEKVTLFREVRFGILISRDENFGVSIAESLSFGQPVIVSEGVALSEVVRRANAGIVARGLNINSVLSAMLEINRMNYIALSDNAKLASESLEWENVIRIWNSFLTKGL